MLCTMMANSLQRLDPRKTIASLFLLPGCDMSCRFCASESDFSVMTPDQAAALLQALRERSIRNVVLGGGEPFLWPHGLERLTRLARQLGFFVQVCTNGVSLPAGFERIPSIDRYLLPIESVDPIRHDKLRRHPDGHHRIVTDRVRTLAGSDRELTVSTVVTRENVGELGAIAGFLRDARAAGVAVHAWHLYRFLPVGRGGQPNADRLSVPRGTFVRACTEARRRVSGFTVYRRDNMLRSSTVEFFWFEGGALRIGSRATPSATPAPGGAG
jgi:MoaA/NifB/PqqE/SkfB family radical SAM enzyme